MTPTSTAARLTSERPLLHYALIFGVTAMVLLLFSWGGLAAGALGLARLTAMFLIMLAVLGLSVGLLRGH